MNFVAYVVSYNFDLLLYQCYYEKEKKKSPENNEKKWSSWKLLCRLKFYKEKRSQLLVLNLQIPQLVRFKPNFPFFIFPSCESILTLVILGTSENWSKRKKEVKKDFFKKNCDKERGERTNLMNYLVPSE